MSAHWETTKVDGSAMRIYLGVPTSPGPHPGVVIAQHRGGVDEVMQDMVHRLRREGYIAAAPEFFHRLPSDADPSKRTSLLRDNEIVADIKATLAHLKTRQLATTRLGIAGFCMGGRVSYLAAATVPELKAAAVFYGGSIMNLRGDGPTPFERTSDINCPVIGFFGAQDTSPSPDDVAKLDAELTRLGKWHEFHTYLDTGHGFHNFILADRYRERAARGSWNELLAFFSQYLKRGTD